MSNIVLVCGGRDFCDGDSLWDFLSRLHAEERIDMLVHGDARGADYLAGLWAMKHGVPMAAVPAQWDVYGSRAGHVRNASMLLLKPSCVVACPGGAGTANMVKQAKAAGISVLTLD